MIVIVVIEGESVKRLDPRSRRPTLQTQQFELYDGGRLYPLPAYQWIENPATVVLDRMYFR